MVPQRHQRIHFRVVAAQAAVGKIERRDRETTHLPCHVVARVTHQIHHLALSPQSAPFSISTIRPLPRTHSFSYPRPLVIYDVKISEIEISKAEMLLAKIIVHLYVCAGLGLVSRRLS